MNILLLVLVIVEAVGIGFLLFLHFQNKGAISTILECAEEIASRNLETPDISVSGNKQVKRLAECENHIKSSIQAFIEATKGNVITLSDSIDVLSKAAEANESGTEQTSNSICIVAEKATEQLELVRDNLSLIEQNDNNLNSIESLMNTITGMLSQSTGACAEGMDNLDKYEKDMAAVERELRSSVNILKEFNEQIRQVNAIGELVVGVSEELQLLALNASIESARAGEAGRGFAVVSQEMAVMSEKTKDSMEEITDILTKVTQSSALVNDSINECNNTFGKSSEVFNDVSQSFRTISSHSMEIKNEVENVTAKYKTISKNSDSSRVKAENVFSASEVISDSTRDIVAVSEEITAESSQITENVSSLEGMLKGIQKLIRQFKNGVVPTKNNRSKKVRIAFFSKLDNYFWYAIRRGVLYAQKELQDNNVEVTYFPYVDDIEECNFPNDVKKCISEGYDSIIFPGFMNKADNELKEAATKGIKIFTYNCDCNSSINRISCYEPDQEEAGIMAANAAAKAINKSGKVAIVVGDRTASVNTVRLESFVNTIKNHYKDISIVDTIEVTYNPEQTYKQVVSLIKAHNDISLIYSTTGMQIQLAKAIEDTGMRGRIKAVVFDQNSDIFDYINKGVIAAAIDHDPFSQGHDPIIYMYNHLVDGTELSHDRIKCKASVVDTDNIGDKVCIS